MIATWQWDGPLKRPPHKVVDFTNPGSLFRESNVKLNPVSPVLFPDSLDGSWNAPTAMNLERKVVHIQTGRCLTQVFSSNCYCIFRVTVVVAGIELDSPLFFDMDEVYHHIDDIRNNGVANPLAFLSDERIPAEEITSILLEGKNSESSDTWVTFRESHYIRSPVATIHSYGIVPPRQFSINR